MAINEKNSYTEYTVTTPTTDFAFGFEYVDNTGNDIIHVTVDDKDAVEVGYTFRLKNPTTIEMTPAVPSGVVRIFRETNIDLARYKFSSGALFRAENVDADFQQVLFSQQEVRDAFDKLYDDVTERMDGFDGAIQEAKDAADRAEAAADRAEDAVADIPNFEALISEIQHGIPNKYRPELTYVTGDIVLLEDGSEVISTRNPSTTDPNVDMSGGWRVHVPLNLDGAIAGNITVVGNILYPEYSSFSYGCINGIPLKRPFDFRNYYAEKPADFDWDVHGVRAWLDRYGKFQHSLNPSTFDIASKAVTPAQYFVKNGGVNGTGNAGTDPASPLGAIYAAIDRINTNNDANAIIWIAPEVYTDGNVWGPEKAIKSNVSIKIWNGSITAPYLDNTGAYATITTETTGLVWAPVGSSSYSTTRSAVGAVVDTAIKNRLGDDTLYEKVADLAACQAKKGSWAQVGSILYVHTLDDRIPDTSVKVYVTKINGLTGTGNYTLYIERVKFYGGTQAFYGASTSLTTNEYVFFNDCAFKYATNNNLETRGIRYTICYNTLSPYSGADGLNYHTSFEQPTKISYHLEINCLTYQNGKSWSNLLGSNNGSTVHDGCYVVRFNTTTFENEGPNFADVGGGKSWLFYCQAYNSRNPNVLGTHADYYTQNNIMWLDHCDASGSNYAYSADGNGRIHIRNCNGYARVFQGNKLVNWNTSVIPTT